MVCKVWVLTGPQYSVLVKTYGGATLSKQQQQQEASVKWENIIFPFWCFRFNRNCGG